MFWSGRRKPGPTRAAIEELAAGSARFDPVLLEMARATADLVDAAKRQQDPKLWLSAAQRLLALRAQLVASGEHDGDAAASGAADGVPGLAGLLGGAPEVRDPGAP